MDKIRVAIAGIGNCASSLIQGIEYYRTGNTSQWTGLMHESIGGWHASDIEIVAAFDIDQRKVGHSLEDAVFAAPNCARVFQPVLPAGGVTVHMGPVLDGVAGHMEDYPEDEAFRPADEAPVDVTAALRSAGADVLICYLPVGSEQAVRHYARACLDAGVALVNCVPVFLASDVEWGERFRAAGLPIIGDDIKSQVGATIVHRTLCRLFADRGSSSTGPTSSTPEEIPIFSTCWSVPVSGPRSDRRRSRFRASSMSDWTVTTSTSVLPITSRGRTTTRSPSFVWRGEASVTYRSIWSSGSRSRTPPTARVW